MKKVIMTLLVAVFVLVPFGVKARTLAGPGSIGIAVGNYTVEEYSEDRMLYSYPIYAYSYDDAYLTNLSFTVNYIHAGIDNMSFNSVDELSLNNYTIGDNFNEYHLSVNEPSPGVRLYYGGDENSLIGYLEFTLPVAAPPVEMPFSISNGEYTTVPVEGLYRDDNEYSLTVSDVNSIGEYTIELFVGNLVFDFNENFDGSFTWESHGESGIKINNLSSKPIRVAFDWHSNIDGLTLGLGSSTVLRVSAETRSDCLNYYNVYGLDRGNAPEEWHSDTYYSGAGLFTRKFFTDATCTTPLEDGSVYSSNQEYYFIDNADASGTISRVINVEAYDQNEYVYPGVDYDFELSGGSLEEVQRVQRGNKKIGTITVTIVGV